MPFALIALGLMVVAGNFLLSFVAPEAGGAGGAPYIDSLAQFTDLLTSPTIRMLGICSIIAGGWSYMMGYGPLFPVGSAEPDAKSSTAPAKSIRKPILSPVAKIASDRASAALGRLRSMPSDTFTAEALTEYEAIRDKHLPDLRSAHSKARAAFPADSQEAATLDDDLAGSLDLISDKLDELIADCGDEARTGFDVARRFVELRHPSDADPLALPSVHMVEKGQ